MLNMDLNAVVDNDELISKIQSALSGDIAEAQVETQQENEQNEILEAMAELPEEEENINEQSASAEPNPLTSQGEITGLEISIGDELVAKHVSQQEHTDPPSPPPPAPVGEEKKEKENISSTKDESIRVALSKVEMLNNYVGELVILQTVLNQRGQHHLEDELMKKSLHQLGKLSKEIQDIAMGLRMVPIKTTMAKMTRIVRDTSKSLNKHVDLEIIGEETEIDKTVLEHLADPLVHIVRNAIDHGLESTEQRIESGKDQSGHVQIKACHEGNNLVLEVIDDGKGIDPNIIRTKAIEKGIINSQSHLSDLETINLIFHPGFSTKEQVTEVSGRGVGMDVVKTNIERLSGQVIVMSEVGKGSTFRIQLPLTLAIIEGMVVNISDERYVVPFIQVSEFLRPNKDDIHFVSGIGECLDLRGEVLPILFVEEALKQPLKEKSINTKTAIIITSGRGKYAVLVDEVVNQQQIVIKKLGREIRDQEGFMGSAILADGRPAIILDLIELFSQHKKISQHTQKAMQRTL